MICKFTLRGGLIGSLVLIANFATAQQDPYYSHFKFNKQSYNSAAAGEKDDYYCVNGVAHYQWLNLDDQTKVRGTDFDPAKPGQPIQDVAPKTYAFNLGGQVKFRKGRNSIGLGLSLFDDKVIFLKTTTVKFQAAYHIRIPSKDALLAVGPEIGFSQFGFQNADFKSLDPLDANIPIGSANESKLNIGFGTYYRQKRLGSSNFQDFYAGFSATNLNAAKYQLTVQNQAGTAQLLKYEYARNLYLLTGTNWYVTPSITLEPALLIKKAFGATSSKAQIDLNATALWNKTFRAGAGYRQWANSDAVTIMLGYVRNELQVGYSYDVTLSKLSQVSNNTHEIMVSYCFRPPTVKPPVKNYRRNTRWL
jgi:type IX secretion system PorP/SprF family membrane protein